MSALPHFPPTRLASFFLSLSQCLTPRSEPMRIRTRSLSVPLCPPLSLPLSLRFHFCTLWFLCICLSLTHTLPSLSPTLYFHSFSGVQTQTERKERKETLWPFYPFFFITLFFSLSTHDSLSPSLSFPVVHCVCVCVCAQSLFCVRVVLRVFLFSRLLLQHPCNLMD